MSLTREDVKHVASLARLGLSDDELDVLQEQLSSILGHIEVLNAVDTDAIPPTAQVIALENVFRPDDVRESLPQQTVISLAPKHREGFIEVDAVLGGGDEGGSA
jgi:aspartyl-tRNA(Asn)/glutamyl-tRNA(Gln) amidotransferase subunit C